MLQALEDILPTPTAEMALEGTDQEAPSPVLCAGGLPCARSQEPGAAASHLPFSSGRLAVGLWVFWVCAGL